MNKLNLLWRTVYVNVVLNVFRPWGWAALAALVIWSVAVPGIGMSKADFLARAQELGYPPLSDARLAGLGIAQVASSFMTLFGVLFLLNSLDRERDIGLDELLASLPLSESSFVALQYVANVVTLLFFTLVAYVVALIAYPFRGASALILPDFLWPGLLFPLGSAFLLAALPLFLDVLHIHHVMRGIAYGIIMILFNLGPFALSAMTNLNHPRHPLFQLWLTASLGLDTFGMWYLQGYLELVFQVIEQLGTVLVPSHLFWTIVLRPRLASIGLGLLLAAFSVWQRQRFGAEP